MRVLTGLIGLEVGSRFSLATRCRDLCKWSPLLLLRTNMSTSVGSAGNMGASDNAGHEDTSSTTKRPRNKQPIIGTHSGVFHCDEVLACFMLRQLPEYENAEIFRSRNEKELQEKCDIIVDVGSVFDHERKWYDHHQKGFNSTLSSLRPELGDEFQIRLSSAGLVYTYYGERVIESILKQRGISISPENVKLSYVQIYRNFISEIDAIDNGVPMFEGGGQPAYTISTNISSRIATFNPSWDEEGNIDIQQRFDEAMAMVGKEFAAKVLNIGGSWVNAREIVRSALLSAKSVYESGEILLLERFCPWKVHLAELEKEHDVVGIPKLVIFSDGANWRVAGVPISPDNFLGRQFLPEPWRGLRDEKLSTLAGVPDLIFVHHSGFIGGATTKEAALAMAIKSIQWKVAA